MKNIVILYGGKSGEHEVSLQSGGSVFLNLDRSLYNPILIGVDHSGIWYLQKNTGFQKDKKSLILTKKKDTVVSAIPGMGLFCDNKKIEADIIFPVLHGTFGEDGTLQGLLELINIPYAGSSVLGSALGMDKAVSKQLWIQENLPVVPFLTIRNDESNQLSKLIEKSIKEFVFPIFVKPANAGSSLGVTKTNSVVELEKGINNGFKYDTKLLIEPAVTGREIECSVIGNFSPVSFLPGEVISSNFYDYDSKYIHPETVELITPAVLSESEIISIKKIAEKAYTTVNAEGFARVDFFIEKKSGNILINEINTLPGFTEISMFAKLCDVSGLPYKDMLTRIIQLAEERYKRKNKLIFRKE